MGIPYNYLDNDERSRYKSILENYPGPITIIQNKNDSHGSADQIKNMLESLDYTLIIKESDDHKYDYPEEVFEIVNS
jgi:hypothetical protein